MKTQAHDTISGNFGKEELMPHVQGVSRDAVVLLPPSLDEYISADNPVRFLDAFVDQLDLQGLGFTRMIPATWPSH